MNLKEYLKKERYTVTAFAKLLKYSRSHLTAVINGKCLPGNKLCERIKEVTGIAMDYRSVDIPNAGENKNEI